jgi:hypothetical protein
VTRQAAVPCTAPRLRASKHGRWSLNATDQRATASNHSIGDMLILTSHPTLVCARRQARTHPNIVRANSRIKPKANAELEPPWTRFLTPSAVLTIYNQDMAEHIPGNCRSKKDRVERTRTENTRARSEKQSQTACEWNQTTHFNQKCYDRTCARRMQSKSGTHHPTAASSVLNMDPSRGSEQAAQLPPAT